MLGTPKRGRRLGGDAAHQKAMLGNLVASLIAAEVARHHRGQGQGPAAGGREVHHRGPQGRGAPAPPGGGPHPRQGHGPQAVRGDRAPLRRPAGRLHPHPQARARARGTTPRWPASSSSDVPGRTRGRGAPARRRRHACADASRPGGPCLAVAYDGSGFRGFAAQPGRDHGGRRLWPRPWPGRPGWTSRPASSAPGAPTPGCTPGARWSTSTCPASSAHPAGGTGPMSPGDAGPGAQPPAGPGRRRPVGRAGPRRLRRPPVGHRPPLPLPGAQRTGRPTPCSPRWPGT